MRHAILALLSAAGIGLAAGCHRPQVEQAELFVFGTLVDVTVQGVDAATAERAFAQLQADFQVMHRDWHAWEPGALTRINEAFASGQSAPASPDIIRLVRQSQFVEERSGGRFNAAIGALIGLWGFHTSEFPILGPPPDPEAIAALVEAHPSSLDISIAGDMLSSDNPAVQLDFGGIAKGYAIDLACDRLREMGIDDAIVNAGGDLRAIGDHGDRPWRVAIRNPGGGVVGSLETRADEAVFTSGNYERFREDAGARYPHILDPATGWPVKELSSVTVIADEGWLADAAATALIVAGPSAWRQVAEALGLDQVLVVDGDGRVQLTPAMRGRVELVAGIEVATESEG